MPVLISWLIARLKEPSTYTGLAAVLLSFHVILPASVAGVLPIIGAAIAGVLGIVVPEAAPKE